MQSDFVRKSYLNEFMQISTFGIDVTLLAAQSERAEQGQAADGDQRYSNGGCDSGAGESQIGNGILNIPIENNIAI